MSKEQCTTLSVPHEGPNLTRCMSVVALVIMFIGMLLLSDHLAFVRAASDAHLWLGYLTRLAVALASTATAYLAPDFARRRVVKGALNQRLRRRPHQGIPAGCQSI